MGISIACQHFLNMGLTRIGYIGGNAEKQTGRERFEGYLDAMRTAGVPIDQRLLRQGDFSRASGERAMADLLNQPNIPQAVVIANDLMAVGAYRICLERGLRVPQDIAIIGMDDSELAQCMNLSSVTLQEEQIGLEAARLLMERILGKRQEKTIIRLQPRLAIRASSEKI